MCGVREIRGEIHREMSTVESVLVTNAGLIS